LKHQLDLSGHSANLHAATDHFTYTPMWSYQRVTCRGNSSDFNEIS